MRAYFDEQLQLLNKEIIELGMLCERGINILLELIKSKEDQQKRLKEITIIGDETNEKERKIEAICLKLLLQQQPVASDLRQISAALKMITDMERIADQVEDIARIASKLDHAVSLQTIEEMGRKTTKMLTMSIDAFVKRDESLAQEVISRDDKVDELFKSTKKQLISHIIGNPNDGAVILDNLMIAKYFERIGDHTTNIAEWVLFSIYGDHKKV